MKTLNKIKPYLINIIFVLSIFLIALILNHTSPFGNQILGNSDAIVQYKPMLFNFITKLRSGTLLNYSFNNALGNPFIFEYSYYLSSPFNLIAVFFKNADNMFISTIILKLILGTIFTTYYVKSKIDNPYIIFIATISYMFSSFFLTYYSFITWLDIFILLPLFQKGLEDLIDKKKQNIYIISLALITICNFYLAFSIYIYTILYYIIYCLFYKKTTKKDKIDTFNRLAIFTILTFIMIFVYIYILFEIYVKTGIGNGNADTAYQITFINLLKSLLYGNINLVGEIEGKVFPNYSCNYFVLMNTLYFFFNKKIDKKTKKYSLIIILIFLLAIYIKPIDYIFNFFHEVRGFPYRYSFIISLLNIKLLITNLQSFEKTEPKKILFTVPIILLLIIITWKQTDTLTSIFQLCFISAYIIILLLYADNKIHKLLLCLIIFLEALSISYLKLTIKYDKEDIDYSKYNLKNEKYRNNYAISSDELLNNNMYYNKKVTYQFTSMSYHNVANLSYFLGCTNYENSLISCTEGNKITNLLFNVQNDYYLEKIFAVNKELLNIDYSDSNNIKHNTENIIYGMTGIKDIYDTKILEAKEDDENYIFDTDYDFYLIEVPTKDSSTAIISQELTSFTQNKEHGKKTATIYTLNEDKLKEVYDYLSKNQIQYTYYNDNKIEGNIHVDNDQIIYTSIPFDKSWTVKVDGKPAQLIFLMDSLIGIYVEPGDHTISMEYKNNDYIGPTIVSLSTIILYIVYNIKKKKA